ncbi:MAG TPA: PAS domain S-box protein [Terriglobia bacterium]|nr:PAS domain S-box protein [Terriglobia bacterium]
MKPALSTYELQQREHLFRMVFEHAPDAIFIEDFDGNVLDANPAACRLHGLSQGQLVGMHVSQLVPEEYRYCVAGHAELMEGEVEGFSLTADGTKVPVSICSSVIEYMGRRAVLLHVRDNTKRYIAEAALRESEERYRLLFDFNPEPMWVHDRQTRRFIAVNESAQRLYKYSRDEFLQMPSIDEICIPDELEQCRMPNLPNLVEVATVKHRRKDGGTLTVELTQHTMMLDGRFAVFVMVNRVISWRR